MNKENLKRMAEYIATIQQEKFDMSTFRKHEHYQHECDSVGCVIGYCTILDDWDNIPKYKYNNANYIDFFLWSEQFTGLKWFSDEWEWCFSAYWCYTDNTSIGASKRIMWLLENGLPKDCMSQLLGESKLCYI